MLHWSGLRQLLWWLRNILTRPTRSDSRKQGQGGSAGGVVALEGYTAVDPDEAPQQGKPDTAYTGCEQAGLHKPHEAKRRCKAIMLKSLCQIF